MKLHHWIVLIALSVGTGAWLLWRYPIQTPAARTNTSEHAESPVPQPTRSKLPPGAPSNEPGPQSPRNRLAYLEQLSAEMKISAAQLTGYLEVNRRSAGSLLAAYALCRDTNLLQEAIERFPGNPRVAYTAWFRSQTPEEKRKWLETMQQADPENSLPAYLLANELLAAGRKDEALGAAQDAFSRPRLSDYALESIQDHEEAYLAAGIGETDAKALATMGHLLPQLAKLRELGRGLTEMASSYAAAGDPASAEAVLEIGLQMAQRLNQENFVIANLVGIAIEDHLLQATESGSLAQFGADAAMRRQDLARERAELKERMKRFEQVLEAAPEADLRAYFDRLKLLGEIPASEWLLQRAPPEN